MAERSIGMKRIVTVVIFAMMMGSVLFAGGKKEAPGGGAGGDQSLTYVMERGKLILGLDDSFPPMGFRNENNEIVGYDVDLAKEAARRMGVSLVLQPIDWNAKEQELNTKEIDCIWNGFSITDERRTVITYSPPYLENAQVMVVKDSSPVRTLADLAGKVIGLQAGSSSVDALEEAAELKASVKEVIEYKDYLTALMDLDVGGVDGILIDLVVANDNIKRSGKNFRILEETLAAEQFGIGFRKGEEALMNKVWETLLEMAKDGTVAGIAVRWLGADISLIGK
jgi:polar amino acid transport system substrate-binding protein